MIDKYLYWYAKYYSVTILMVLWAVTESICHMVKGSVLVCSQKHLHTHAHAHAHAHTHTHSLRMNSKVFWHRSFSSRCLCIISICLSFSWVFQCCRSPAELIMWSDVCFVEIWSVSVVENAIKMIGWRLCSQNSICSTKITTIQL